MKAHQSIAIILQMEVLLFVIPVMQLIQWGGAYMLWIFMDVVIY